MPPTVPPLGMPRAGSARPAAPEPPPLVVGVGAPNASRDISQDKAFLKLQQLQADALADVDGSGRGGAISLPEAAGKDSKKPLMSRMIRSLSFKMKRSPAKSPRDQNVKSPRGASQPCSPEGSPRSQPSHSREQSPRTPHVLTSIVTHDPAPPPRMGDSTFRQPRWDGNSTVFDPLEGGGRKVAASQAPTNPRAMPQGRATPPPAAAPPPATEDDASFVKGFDDAYESAADAAAMELMQRATQRGEKFKAAVARPDFVAAVAVMATHLGLALDPPQIEQLFHAVSGGAATVQFEDFIEAHSTRYYMKELAAGQLPRRTSADPDLVA